MRETPAIAEDAREEELCLSVTRGDIARVCALIDGGVNVNARFVGGDTLLHAACGLEDALMVETLLGYGAEVEAKSAIEDTPFARASTQRNKAICRRLLEAGADCNVIWKNGETPLRIAVRQYSLDFIDFLISAGASSSITPAEPEITYLTPFQWAVYHGFDDIVLLIASRCSEDLGQRTVRNRSLLQIAGSDKVKDVLRSSKASGSIDDVISASGASASSAGAREPSARKSPDHVSAL